jgi:osmotically inducible lipoprotein OsmB
MKNKLTASFTLIAALTLTGCTVTDTQRRTMTGAGVGGAAAGLISGEWGWAAAGAAAGAVGGYLYDQHKKSEEDAYERGATDAKTR